MRATLVIGAKCVYSSAWMVRWKRHNTGIDRYTQLHLRTPRSRSLFLLALAAATFIRTRRRHSQVRSGQAGRRAGSGVE